MDLQLDNQIARYEELTTYLSNPGDIHDQRQFQARAKEHAELKPIIETYRECQRIEHDLLASRELAANETDPQLREMAFEEVATLEPQLATLLTSIRALLLPKDPNDERNVLLEIRGGAGGDEAALFAGELFRMYSRFTERRGWQLEVMDINATGLGGLKEVVALIRGQGAYSTLKYESGVHRVQRVPKTEGSGRVHTSTVTVAVLPEAEEIDVQINDGDLRVDVFRASGPGGQGVNTTDSAVRITHVPSGLVVVCREERSQLKNKSRAMKILRTRLLEQQHQAQDASMREERRSQVGSGDRSEKIRTYNFPQNRMTDHRIGLNLHHIEALLDGELDDLISALRNHYQAEALQRQQTS